MKVVINNCYGGFGLSNLAIKELATLNGKECSFFKKKGFDGYYIPITLEEANKEFIAIAFSVPNPNELLKKPTKSRSIEENKKFNDVYRQISLNSRPDDRGDKNLITVVEKLGKASCGKYSELKIIEIPDDVSYDIDEYDGIESIHEKHKSWN